MTPTVPSTRGALTPGPGGSMCLMSASALTFAVDVPTHPRRSTPVPQLGCVAGCDGIRLPPLLTCYNHGWISTGGVGSVGSAPPDGGCGTASDLAWSCAAEGLDGNVRLAPNLTISCEPWEGAGGWIVSGSCYARYSLLRVGAEAAVGGGGEGAAAASASTASACGEVPSAHGLTAWALGGGLLVAFVLSLVYIGATVVATICGRFGCGRHEGDGNAGDSDSDGDSDGDGDAADSVNGRRRLRRAECSHGGGGALTEGTPLLAATAAGAERVRAAGGTPAVVPAAVRVPVAAASGASAAGARGGSHALHDCAGGPR